MSILFRRVYWAADDEGGGEVDIKGLLESAAAEEREAAAKKASTEATKASTEATNEEKKARDELAKSRTRDMANLKREAELLQDVKEETDKHIKTEKNLIEQMKLKLHVGENLSDQQKQNNEDIRTEIKLRQESLEAYEDSAAAGEDLAQALFGVGDAAKRNEKFAKIFTKSGLKGLTAGFKKNFKVANLVDSAFTSLAIKTFELAMAQDKAISSFRTATGAGKQYNLEIAALERSTFAAGVTVEDAANAYKDLYTSFNAFTELSATERKNIGETVTLIEKMGVSSSDSAKILNTATKSLGMNATESEALLRDIVSTAQTVGRSVSEVSADFISASSKLAFHGDKLTGIFQKLQMQAKSTGLEMDTLLSFAAQFDTFDGAGRAVGRLNAIMGGPYLNSIDMLNATEEERIEIMQRSMKMAGLSFDQMSKYEQLAIADAMGVSAEEARKMFGTVTAEMEIQRLKEEELAAQAAEMQTLMEQLRASFMALATDLRPFVEVMSGVVSNFAKFLSMGDGIIGTLALVATGVAYATVKFLLWKAAIMGTEVSMAALGKTTLLAVGWAALLIGGFMAFNKISSDLDGVAKGVALLGLAVLAAAVAMALLTSGISWGIGLGIVAGSAGILAGYGLQGGAKTPDQPTSSAAGRFSGQKKKYGGTVEGTPGTMQPTQYSEDGRAEFGITPAGTTFADAQTVNSLIKALEANTKAREQEQRGGGGTGGAPTVVLQMGNKQIEFDKAVVDAAWKSRSAKQTVGALQ